MKKSWILIIGLLVISVAVGLGCGSSSSSSTTTTVPGATTTTTPGATTTTTLGTLQVLQGTVSYSGPSSEVIVQALKVALNGILGQSTATVSGGHAVFSLTINGTVGDQYYLVAVDGGDPTSGVPGVGNYAGALGWSGSADSPAANIINTVQTQGTVLTLSTTTQTGLNFSMHKLI